MEISRRGFLAGSVSAACASRVSAETRQAPPPRVPGAANLPYLSIHDAAALLRTRRLSPVQLTEAVLERITRIEPRVHAFITVTRDEAMGAARTAEQEIAAGKYRGPLHGIPFAVKDTHYTKGIRTTANTPVFRDFVPDFDATVVARLKAGRRDSDRKTESAGVLIRRKSGRRRRLC